MHSQEKSRERDTYIYVVRSSNGTTKFTRWYDDTDAEFVARPIALLSSSRIYFCLCVSFYHFDLSSWLYAKVKISTDSISLALSISPASNRQSLRWQWQWQHTNTPYPCFLSLLRDTDDDDNNIFWRTSNVIQAWWLRCVRRYYYRAKVRRHNIKAQNIQCTMINGQLIPLSQALKIDDNVATFKLECLLDKHMTINDVHDDHDVVVDDDTVRCKVSLPLEKYAFISTHTHEKNMVYFYGIWILMLARSFIRPLPLTPACSSNISPWIAPHFECRYYEISRKTASPFHVILHKDNAFLPSIDACTTSSILAGAVNKLLTVQCHTIIYQGGTVCVFFSFFLFAASICPFLLFIHRKETSTKSNNFKLFFF